MTEEFDALLTFDLLSGIGIALLLVVIGILLEVGLRFAQRWSAARNWQMAGVVLGALRWQPLIWSILLASAWLLAGLSEVSVARQQGLGILGGLLLVSVTIIVVRILSGLLKIHAAQRPSASVSLLNYMINFAAIVIVVVVGLYALDVPVSLQLATLFGSTLGLSLALREPLANLFAGVVLTASNRLSPGDYVQLSSGERGRILDIGWDVTSIQQRRDSLLIVPNSRMNEAEMINFDRPTRDFEVRFPVGVSYVSDLQEVERVTLEVADSVLRDRYGREPAAPSYIRFKEFADSDIKFAVHITGQFVDRHHIRNEFMQRLHRRYAVEGIVMPDPSRTLNTLPDEPLRVVIGEPQGQSAPGGAHAAVAAEGSEEVPGV